MSDINSHSLIGFLQKKSLFAASPSKSTKLRSRSKGKSPSISSSRTPHHKIDESTGLFNSDSSRRLPRDRSDKKLERQVQAQPLYPESQYEPKNYYAQSETPAKRNFSFGGSQGAPKGSLRDNDAVSNLLAGLVNQTMTFESARLESIQCLNSLGVRIQTEVSNINFKIQAFHSEMSKMLNKEFSALQTKIYAIVDQVFAESQRIIKEYVRYQEGILAKELLNMKDQLMEKHEKIEIMQSQILKAHWKKVAGELLSSDLEAQVDSLIDKSQYIAIKHWQVGDLGKDKVRQLEDQLRDMVHLVPR